MEIFDGRLAFHIKALTLKSKWFPNLEMIVSSVVMKSIRM